MAAKLHEANPRARPGAVRLPVVSGRDLVRAFESFGYVVVRRRASHIRLRHPNRAHIPLTVPDHREVKRGLLCSLVRDAGISLAEFVQALG
jgi:predicted RNA binding protein YcfA (HicA-like mRNA interferase family)